MSFVAGPTLTTAGMPYSRATMLPWLNSPPWSITMPVAHHPAQVGRLGTNLTWFLQAARSQGNDQGHAVSLAESGRLQIRLACGFTPFAYS